MSESDVELPHWAWVAVEHKARWLASGPAGDPPPLLLPFWAGTSAAFVLVHGGFEDLMRTAATLRAGFEPDALVLAADSFEARRDRGDPAGEELMSRLASGGLSLTDLARDHQGVERGLITETVVALRGDRSGAVEGWAVPYRRTGVATVDWDRPWPMTNGGGRLHDLLRAVMADPASARLDVQVAAAVAGAAIDPDRARLIRASAALQVLRQGGLSATATHPDLVAYEAERAGRRRRRPDPTDRTRRRRRRKER